MIVESKSPTLLLKAGEILRLPEGSCARIECDLGAVWVTEDGDQSDRVLAAGDSARIGRGSLALVQAFEPSTVRLVANPAGCAPATRGASGGLRRWLGAARAAHAGAFAA